MLIKKEYNIIDNGDFMNNLQEHCSDNLALEAFYIKSEYVGPECALVMLSYDNWMVLLDKNTIKYCDVNNINTINTYIHDERNKLFPYYDLPIHYEYEFFKKVKVVNQLFEYNKIYFCLSDGNPFELFLMKNNDKTILYRRKIDKIKAAKILSRDDFEKLYISGKNEKTYLIANEGNIYSNSFPINNISHDYKNEEYLSNCYYEDFKLVANYLFSQNMIIQSYKNYQENKYSSDNVSTNNIMRKPLHPYFVIKNNGKNIYVNYYSPLMITNNLFDLLYYEMNVSSHVYKSDNVQYVKMRDLDLINSIKYHLEHEDNKKRILVK